MIRRIRMVHYVYRHYYRSHKKHGRWQSLKEAWWLTGIP